MGIFTKLFNRNKAEPPCKANAHPEKTSLGKSAATAATAICAVLVTGKIGWNWLRKKVIQEIEQRKEKSPEEVKAAVNQELESFIKDSAIRWLIYLALILLAYLVATTFNLRKDVLVTFVILGIYSFYLLKAFVMFHWYRSFCKVQKRLIFNPRQMIRAYLRSAIRERVDSIKNQLPRYQRLAMDFFGPANDKLASEIADTSLGSDELKREAFARLGVWGCGCLIYWLIYRQLFLFVTHIEFNAFWEPLIWPFHVLLSILSVQP